MILICFFWGEVKYRICSCFIKVALGLQAEKHHPALVKLLCAELGVEPAALLDFELCLTDTQPAVSLQINL